jgi:hypothetical protein
MSIEPEIVKKADDAFQEFDAFTRSLRSTDEETGRFYHVVSAPGDATKLNYVMLRKAFEDAGWLCAVDFFDCECHGWCSWRGTFSVPTNSPNDTRNGTHKKSWLSSHRLAPPQTRNLEAGRATKDIGHSFT